MVQKESDKTCLDHRDAKTMRLIKLVYMVTFVISIILSFSLIDFNTVGKNCSCECCITDRGMEEEWFSLRYKHNIQLMLNKRNSVLDKRVNAWWRNLQYRRSRTSYEAVVGKLFSHFPNEEHYSDAGPGRCRTCAVVGNSGNLVGSHYGPLIDFHDFVIRINKGPTEGYEKDVGSKTTHRIVYPESAVDLDSSTHLVFFPFKILDLEWLISAFTTKHITHTYRKVRSTIKANKKKVKILHPAFIKYVYENWSQRHGTYPSTGFITIILALHICDEVRVFGFGAKSSGHWHHYFDTSLTKFNKDVHAGDFENKTIHYLHQIKKITMYTGWN